MCILFFLMKMIIVLFRSFYYSCIAANHSSSLAFKVGKKCKCPIYIHGVVKQYSHVLLRPHCYALYWTKIACTNLTCSALVLMVLIYSLLSQSFLCRAERKLGKKLTLTGTHAWFQNRQIWRFFLPNRQDFCGYTNTIITNFRDTGVMDRRTDNLNFMYAPIYVGFTLVCSFNVDHPIYIFAQFCQKQLTHDACKLRAV